MKTVPNIHSLAKPTRISEAKINISNLRLRTFIGFNPDEKTKQQDVIVNAEIHYRADSAFISDDQDDALNYKNITKLPIPNRSATQKFGSTSRTRYASLIQYRSR
jgi:D-erythro-7,8-dihydroneopterin triphosphate epimerase